MADLSITATLTDLNNSGETIGVTALQVTQAGANKRYTEGRLTLTTTPGVAIPIPGGTLGTFCFMNLDAAIVMSITPATGGTVTMIMNAGECLIGRFGGSVTAPFAFSASGTPVLRYRVNES